MPGQVPRKNRALPSVFTVPLELANLSVWTTVFDTYTQIFPFKLVKAEKQKIMAPNSQRSNNKEIPQVSRGGISRGKASIERFWLGLSSFKIMLRSCHTLIKGHLYSFTHSKWAIGISQCPLSVVHRAVSTIYFKWQLLIYHWGAFHQTSLKCFLDDSLHK